RKITLMAMMFVLAFGVVAIAGCGGDDKKSSSDTPKTETTKTTDSGNSGDISNNPQVKAAVEQCKQAIDAQPSLKDSTKADLRDLCDKAGSGDIKDAQKASVEVCKKIVEDTVPAGASRDQAAQACEAAAP
ncbi:MAG: hypothetical protein QOI80_1843, partial [Solirubrobacteraceae bacterium]|nr:hypothetical protein [Solirubrobacteraceae bacterium]